MFHLVFVFCILYCHWVCYYRKLLFCPVTYYGDILKKWPYCVTYRMSQNHLHLDRAHEILTPVDSTSCQCRREHLRKLKSLPDGCGLRAGWWCTTTTYRSGCEIMTFWSKVTGHQWTPTGNASSRCFVFILKPATYGLICWVWMYLVFSDKRCSLPYNILLVKFFQKIFSAMQNFSRHHPKLCTINLNCFNWLQCNQRPVLLMVAVVIHLSLCRSRNFSLLLY